MSERKYWAIATQNREFWVYADDSGPDDWWERDANRWCLAEALEVDLEGGPVPVRNLSIHRGNVEATWELSGAPLTIAKDGFARMDWEAEQAANLFADIEGSDGIGKVVLPKEKP